MKRKTFLQNIDKLIAIVDAVPEKELHLDFIAAVPFTKEPAEDVEYVQGGCGSVCCIAGSVALSPLFPEYALVQPERSYKGHKWVFTLYDLKAEKLIDHMTMAGDLLGGEYVEIFASRCRCIDELFLPHGAIDRNKLAIDGKPMSDRTLALARLYYAKQEFDQKDAMKAAADARSHESVK